MTPRLASGPEHEEFAKSIRGICADWFRDEGEIQVRSFDPELWRALGEAGVWGAATGGGGDVEDLAVAAEALGAEAIAGPVVPTSVVLGLLSDDEREPVERGSVLATVSDGHPIVPWGCDCGSRIPPNRRPNREAGSLRRRIRAAGNAGPREMGTPGRHSGRRLLGR